MILKQVFRKRSQKVDEGGCEKELLVEKLKELKRLEAKLWGVSVNELANGEEEVLEDANHLIYLFNSNEDEKLSEILEKKDVKDFLNDLRNLKNQFVLLKKEIKKKEELRNLITNYTIKLVDKKTYSKMEKIFILEKQLYEVIEKQETELEEIYSHFSKIKVDINGKEKRVFLGSLKKIRKILAGHLEHHSLWEDERRGYSNTSNILNSLIKVVNESL